MDKPEKELRNEVKAFVTGRRSGKSAMMNELMYQELTYQLHRMWKKRIEATPLWKVINSGKDEETD